MTQIQNSKQNIRLQSHPTVSLLKDAAFRSDKTLMQGMFRSLNIEICDIFVIWGLRFGISLHYKTFWATGLEFTVTVP